MRPWQCRGWKGWVRLEMEGLAEVGGGKDG